MRALVLTPDFPPAPGGIQLVMSRLVANLERVEPRVVTLAFGSEPLTAPTGVAVVAAGSRGRTGNKISVARLNATSVVEALRFRPAVIVSGHAVTAPAALSARAVTRAPVIQYVHADEARQRSRLFRFAVRRADSVIAVSSYARDLALEAGAHPGAVRVINPGVDTGRATGDLDQRRSDRPTVLTVARMQEPYKGHDTMIRAMPEVLERVPDARWVAVGDGRLRGELEARASSLGVGEAIEFTGHVSTEERDGWLDRAHVFAMPSRLPPEGIGGEGFGIVYLEAGAHGLPVVAGNVGGAVDAVADGETGVLVDPSDSSAVAGAIAALLTDRDRARRLGAAGAKRARGFTWRRHADAVGALMEELASG